MTTTDGEMTPEEFDRRAAAGESVDLDLTSERYQEWKRRTKYRMLDAAFDKRAEGG